MRGIKYNVISESNMYQATSKKNAIEIATEMVSGGQKGVVVMWHRASDGQRGYLNPDGNYAITGNFWLVRLMK